MSRLFIFLAGVWLAAGLATLVASAYTGDGALALLMPLAVIAGIALAWRALRIPFARHGRALLTVACALGAGAVLAYEVAHPGQLGRIPLLLALVAVMGCGATAALERCREGERGAEDATRIDAADETVDLELEVQREIARQADDDRGEADAAAPPLRPFAAVARPIGGLLAAASLLLAVPIAALFLARHASFDAEAGASAQSAAVAPAAAEADATVADAPQATAMKVSTGSGPLSGLGLDDASAAPVVPRAIDASRARRECLAQIESAHLFLNLARQAATPSAYASLTNPQVRHMIESRPIAPRTVQHIVMRMWERRNEPERGPEWWSNQYARCEATRLTGQRYVVRG